MRVLNKWLIVHVYAIANIAINLRFYIFILLNLSFLTLSLSAKCECVNACVHVLD